MNREAAAPPHLSSLAIFVLTISLSPALFAQAPTTRPLAVDDIYRMQEVGDAQCSPDGRWIAYTVTTIDREADKRRTAIWTVNWEGTQNLRLSYGPESDTSPRWSPDGHYLAFLSVRTAGGKTGIWLLDRRGGEARLLTEANGGVVGFEWAPDGRVLVVEIGASDGEGAHSDATNLSASFPKAPEPIVIDGLQFKSDIDGYLTPASRTQLYLLDVDSRKLDPLTADQKLHDGAPAWSPDGTRIAYVRRKETDTGQAGSDDIYVVDAHSGAMPRRLVSTYVPHDEQHLAWSPDGTLIAYLDTGEPKYSAYDQYRLAVVPAVGGVPRLLTETLDRGVRSPEFTRDGSSIAFLVTDDRRRYVAEVPVAGGTTVMLSGTDAAVYQKCRSAGHTAVVASTDTALPEVFALEGKHLRKLTSHNDSLLGELRLGAVRDIAFKSKDGADINGMIITPPDFDASRKYPTIAWIHGGPNLQDAHGLPFNLYPLQLERQLFAASGYVVLAINYRGSSGRGAEFSRSISADWGNKEVADVLAGVDFAVAEGVADPARLGIGGWSYGGMLTSYTIASDARFKAAVSGAGMANMISAYGTDQYIVQYNDELGPPWKSLDAWFKVSYPFFHADRIHTPTLFMGGDHDFNVPIAGSEQMYEALRTLGVPTQLVVYPEQFHLFTRPSYIHDRMQRYIAWFDKFVLAEDPIKSSGAAPVAH